MTIHETSQQPEPKHRRRQAERPLERSGKQPDPKPSKTSSKGKKGNKSESLDAPPTVQSGSENELHAPPALCGAKKRGPGGGTCSNIAGKGTDHVGSGRCRVHAGKSTGPKTDEGKSKSSANTLKHGLFSKSLGPVGLEVYKGAKRYKPDELGRQSAEFVMAQIAQAYEESGDLTVAKNDVEAFIWQQVSAEQMSADAAMQIVRKLRQPTIDQLGKALGSLKGLLEVKKEEEAHDAGDPLGDLMSIIRESRKLRDGGQE